VTVKGSKILEGAWERHQGNIMKMKTAFTVSPYSQLYINGIEQILARYPNFDSVATRYHGYAADVIDPKRVKGWEHPEGAIIHAMHSGEWGGFHYEIESANRQGEVKLRGGHQNNRPSPMHEEYRMVENVYEELDTPREWYFNNKSSTLYYYPEIETNLNEAKIEVSHLKHLIEIKGAPKNPVSDVLIKGIRFEHTNRTFMEKYDPLLRSDWTIYRGGAILFENAVNCELVDCQLENLGGNAIFLSGYDRNVRIVGNHINRCGASAICVVGKPSAVRSPSFTYKEFVEFKDLDKVEGPKSSDYPSLCLIDNNLIHNVGLVEKQIAGVEISIAMNITVRHNSIYDVPRAGINIGDGTWGGHIIEFNDVFNTVLETSDHGAFNSWGRDRFWHPNRNTMDKIVSENPGMPYLDAVHTTIIRNNRFRCDHGWDIDLDDGSSNYDIYNNLCLNGGIKLREGLYRTVENNIMVNNGFHPHVWFKNSGDVFKRNIMMTGYQDIRLQGWGKEIDSNLFPDQDALEKAQSKGTDLHSTFGDPQFLDPVNGNFAVSAQSPAIELGFINFTMNNFGVQKPALKQLAKIPEIPALMLQHYTHNREEIIDWLGSKIKNIESLAERSAAGLNETRGVLISEVISKSLSAQGGLHEGDVIVSCENEKISNINDLLSCFQGNNWKGKLKVTVVRNQQEQTLEIKTK
jgi:hypothetical protein